jgi:hypothetical protein
MYFIRAFTSKKDGDEMRLTSFLIIFSVLTGLFSGLPLAVAQQKTAKACQAEWKANKADNQAKGITEKAYVAQCRGGDAPSSATAPTPAATAASSAATPATITPSTRSAPTTTTPIGANEFAAEGQAKAHCPSDTVVWANLTSRVYHFGGYKDYGNTKRGAYMCEKDATAQGFRASKTEKHPS